MQIVGQVGPSFLSDGVSTQPIRQGKGGEMVMQQLHGRYYEQVARGNVYSVGTASFVALSANTITLTATSTPILGVWNPSTSLVNLVILQAALCVAGNAIGATTGPGPFQWASSVGNTAISTGLTPFNRKTMANSGSSAKGFAGATALTGLTTTPLVIFEAADLPLVAGLATGAIAAGTTDPSQFKGFSGVQNFDGSLIVPPGGVLSLVNTTSTTSSSVAGRLLWEEVPV